MRVVLQGAECSDGGRGAGVTLAGVGPELWGPGMGTWGCKQAATPWPVPQVQQVSGTLRPSMVQAMSAAFLTPARA